MIFSLFIHFVFPWAVVVIAGGLFLFYSPLIFPTLFLPSPLLINVSSVGGPRSLDGYTMQVYGGGGERRYSGEDSDSGEEGVL